MIRLFALVVGMLYATTGQPGIEYEGFRPDLFGLCTENDIKEGDNCMVHVKGDKPREPIKLYWHKRKLK